MEPEYRTFQPDRDLLAERRAKLAELDGLCTRKTN